MPELCSAIANWLIVLLCHRYLSWELSHWLYCTHALHSDEAKINIIRRHCARMYVQQAFGRVSLCTYVFFINSHMWDCDWLTVQQIAKNNFRALGRTDSGKSQRPVSRNKLPLREREMVVLKCHRLCKIDYTIDYVNYDELRWFRSFSTSFHLTATLDKDGAAKYVREKICETRSSANNQSFAGARHHWCCQNGKVCQWEHVGRYPVPTKVSQAWHWVSGMRSRTLGIELHNEMVPHRCKCLLRVAYRCLPCMRMHSRFMRLGKCVWKVHTCTAQGDSFRERNSVFCWRVLTQRQHAIAVQLCSVATGHVPMFSVKLEFVLCKLCCMHCSWTVSMHTVLFYLACWKRHKMGDLSTAGTTACIVIFHMGHIFVKPTVVIPLPLWAFATWPTGTLWRKNCWGTWWVDIAWHAMACLQGFVLMSANNYAITGLDTVRTLYLFVVSSLNHTVIVL